MNDVLIKTAVIGKVKVQKGKEWIKENFIEREEGLSGFIVAIVLCLIALAVGGLIWAWAQGAFDRWTQDIDDKVNNDFNFTN